MRFFTASDDGTAASINNLPPVCFFLTEEHRCAIHSEHGYAAKPETCRLFPFNNLALMGGFLIVSPHVSLCPLELNPTSTPRTESKHDALFEAMASQGIGAPVPVRSWEDHNAVETIALEQHLAVLSERAVTNGNLAALINAQIDVTAAVARKHPELLGAESDDGDEVPFADEALTNVRSVLGLQEHDLDKALKSVGPLMAAMSPSLRMRWILSTAQSTTDRPVPTLRRLPLALLTTSILAALAKAAGMATVTYQTVMRLASELESLIYHGSRGASGREGGVLGWTDWMLRLLLRKG